VPNGGTLVGFSVVKVPNEMKFRCYTASELVLVEVRIILKQLVGLAYSY
jgi:hypothetical protein